MKKIQLASQILQVFFKMLCWIMPVTVAYLILFQIKGLLNWGWFSFIPSEYHFPSDYTLIHRMVILAIELLPLSMTILIFNNLSKLFGLFKNGLLFETENIKLVKGIGIYLILGELIKFIYRPLITLALSFYNPPGERFLTISLGTTTITTLLIAFIILIAVRILKEALRLKSESHLTI